MLFAVFQCDGWVPSSVVEWWCYLLCFSAMDEFQAVWSSDDVICCVSVRWMSSKQCGRVMMLFAVFQCDGWVPSSVVEWWCYLLCSSAMDEFQAVWSSDDVICCVSVRWMSSKQCGRVMMLFAVFQCDGWVPSSVVEWWCYLLCFSAMDEFQAVWSSDDVICCVLVRWMSSKRCGRVMMLFAVFQCNGWVPSSVVEWWCYLLCSSAMDEFQAVWSSDDVICCVSVRWMSSKQCGRVMMLFAVFQCDGWVPSSVVEWWCYLLCFSAMDEFQAVWSSDDVICCVPVRWMSSKRCGRVMMLFAVFQCDGWVPSGAVEWWCYLLRSSAMDEFQAVWSSDDVICCVPVRWMSSKQCGRVMMLFAVFQCDGWVPSSVVEWWCYLLCFSAMDEFQAVWSSDDVICCVSVRWMSSKQCSRVMMLFAAF